MALLQRMFSISLMEALFEAIVFLCDTLLTPFVQPGSSAKQKPWIIVVGLLIGAVGVLAVVGLILPVLL